ncbi:MAG: hypothetical protein A2176_13965 [Spirochaetes bacterium RBG_13_51_14]|nr:MAG: hypothetical protein A2176_13965 [Spirochaetes bacterium RBG_13_51_14]
MANPKKILIVENDAPSAVHLSQILKTCGYMVFDPVESGAAAVKTAFDLSPDLILMDINLEGDIDGITAALMIKERCGIPCIYSTVSMDDATIKKTRGTAPYGYILKPYDKNMICATVDMALNRSNLERRLQDIEVRTGADLTSQPDTVFYIDRDGGFGDESGRTAARHVWTKKTAARAETLIRGALEKQIASTFHYALVRRAGTSYYEAQIVPDGGERARVIVRDVTLMKMGEGRRLNRSHEPGVRANSPTRELAALHEDLEREISLRRDLEQNCKVFGHALEQNPHLIVIVSKAGIVEYVNAAFTDISGYDKSRVIGTNMNRHGNLIVTDPEIWKTMINTDQWNGELHSLNRNGDIYFMLATTSSVRDDMGEASHYIITAENITEEKQEKMIMDEVRQTLDRSGREFQNRDMDWKEWQERMMERNISRIDKSLFKHIYNSFSRGAGFGTLISHIDLMLSSAEQAGGRYIVDSGMIDMIQSTVNIIKDALKTFTSINWIINNDFDLQKTSLIELYEIAKVVVTTVSEYRSIGNNRIIMNEFNPRFKDSYVNLNKDYFPRALYEILINAMKFSKKNSYITVFVSIMGRNATLSVINDPEKSDDGIIGIPIEYEKAVFEPFFRLTGVVHDQYNTLEFGLGLTLVEKIVGKHGGDVTARNIIDHSDARRESQVKVSVSISLPLA